MKTLLIGLTLLPTLTHATICKGTRERMCYTAEVKLQLSEKTMRFFAYHISYTSGNCGGSGGTYPPYAQYGQFIRTEAGNYLLQDDNGQNIGRLSHHQRGNVLFIKGLGVYSDVNCITTDGSRN